MLFFFWHEDSFAQRKKKRAAPRKKRDAIYIRPARINYNKTGDLNRSGVAGGQDVVEKEGLLAGRFVDKTPVVDPEQYNTLRRSGTLLSEDTFSIADGEQSIVEVAEEFQIDSTWVKATEYYSIWDAYLINPYRSDVSGFTDTLDVILFDSTKGQYWKEPLLKSRITSEFGMRGGRWHYGVDLDLDIGDPVLSVWDGVVRLTNWDGGGYGNYVLVRHYNGFETLYGHLSEIECSIGQIVQAGDLLGKGGTTGRSTGPHLHFEVRYRGVPINPLSIFDFRNQQIRSSRFRLSADAFNYLSRRPVASPPSPGVKPLAEPARQPYPTRKVYYHHVRSGDNLYAISRKYGIPVPTLKKLNGMGKSSTLGVGKRLRIR